jgi:protein CpxP
MKIKTLSIIAGTFALALTATPFIAHAQTNTSQPQPRQEWKQKGPFAQLNLTPDQKTQIKQIHESTRTKIEGVLTAEQKATLAKAKEEHKAKRQARRNDNQKVQGEGKGKHKGGPFAELGLTADQKSQIKQIRESEKAQIDAILTPDQKTKLQQFKDNRASRRQQHQENKQPQ